MNYTVFVRDDARRRTVQADAFDDLELRLRFNTPGAWRLTVPADSAAAEVLAFPSGILVLSDLGTTVFSGPLRRRRRVREAGTDSVEASGPDDLTWLTERLALPVPDGPPYSAQAYDVATDVAETVLHHYVSVNAGPGASAARQVAGLVMAADLARGSTVTGRARFDRLDDLLRSLATVSVPELGFRVRQDDAGSGATDLAFSAYVPVDRSGEIVLDVARGTLTRYEYEEVAPESTYVYVGGGGEGTARVIAERGDTVAAGAYGARIERFVDQRQTSDTDELDQAITDELATGGATLGATLEPIDTSTVRYGVDYDLGDLVTAVVDDTTLVEVVREVQITASPAAGWKVHPLVGTPASRIPEAFAGLTRTTRRLHSRVGNLERR